ncbi:MAG TPA: ABC transporter substrate-binding protein [Thermoleophilaceae bacterium]|nr:ABC transporter substrate-binding protein [Thermoleophilaceae bacterium]
MRRRLLAALAVATAAAIGGCGGGDGAGRARPIELALDFQPGAVHAGIYAAADRGVDAGHGIELRIRAPSASSDSLKLLESGRADIAVVDIHDLGLARERGLDVVGVGALVQRPLAAVIARGASRPRELEGKRVGVTGLPSDDAVLRAVVESDGGDYGAVRRTTIGFSAVPALVAGRVEAATAFWNAEGVALRARGVDTNEFRVDEYGAPRYPELVFAVLERNLAESGDLVDDALAAIAEGTERAFADRPRAAARVARASRGEPETIRAQLDAVAGALVPPVTLDRAALEAWAEWDVEFGILKRKPEIAELFPPR